MLHGHIFKVSASIEVIDVKCIVISTYSYKSQIEEYINKRIDKLKEYKPIIKIEQEGRTTFVTCSLPAGIPESKEEPYFKEYVVMPVAKALVDIIEKEFGVGYANEILKTSHKHREIIIVEMAEDKGETRNLLIPIISEITENNTFCLDGWIRFRLSKYKTHVMDMVENLVYEYESYKEYREFITLIKSFISNQRPLMEQVHIIPNKNGQISLYNTKMEKVDIDVDPGGFQDDLVLATLLTLAPLRIIIHKEERYGNIRLITTVKNIYEDRVEFCRGCKLCEGFRLKKGIMRALKDILTQKKL